MYTVSARSILYEIFFVYCYVVIYYHVRRFLLLLKILLKEVENNIKLYFHK